MFTQLFGSYLLNKKLVTPEQLREAMELQKSIRLKLGVMAVNSGFMTAEQVNSVHEMQARVDKMFGELAKEMGFLDDAKLQELLSSQKPDYLMLGQALVDKGYMSLAQFEAALGEYKAEHCLSNEQFKSLQNGEFDDVINIFYNFEDSSRGVLYRHYSALLIKNVIRFIDSSFTPYKVEPINNYKFDWLAAQQINGEVNIYTAIAAREDAFIGFGSKYAGEEFCTSDEYVQASVGEFLNLVNGLFLVNMSNSNVELELTPQVVENSKELSGLVEAYSIPMEFGFGRVEFLISKSSPAVV